MGKWLWRFHIEQGSLWAKVITGIHGIDKNGWDSNQSQRLPPMSPWKAISKLTDVFSCHISSCRSMLSQEQGSGATIGKATHLKNYSHKYLSSQLGNMALLKTFVKEFIHSRIDCWREFIPNEATNTKRIGKGGDGSSTEMTFCKQIYPRRMRIAVYGQGGRKEDFPLPRPSSL